ncbi:Zinc-finger of C2H2 type/Zinc-finger double-stranded RNA-binding [Novymonas esmeraldas]|uniref:Zinc-finger of C2H2 type/Zinc-finger double-stranded RNA-binding n=1 Tax=Novymonas esmeraldas TaxID=1808958 RepID=A0AAW0ERF8_9TRYP
MSSHALSSSSAGRGAASASPPLRAVGRSPFYCAVCDVVFSDSHAAEAHRASRRHKEKSGELAWEARQYKKDSEVTPEDVWALVRRKQVELGVPAWGALQVREGESSSGA